MIYYGVKKNRTSETLKYGTDQDPLWVRFHQLVLTSCPFMNPPDTELKTEELNIWRIRRCVLDIYGKCPESSRQSLSRRGDPICSGEGCQLAVSEIKPIVGLRHGVVCRIDGK